MSGNVYIYILVMAVVTYLVRMLPLTLMRKPIRSRFIRSFLHYVPFACLTAMTFPSILTSTSTLISGVAALVVAVVLAYRKKPLIVVAVASSAAVLITEAVLKLL